MDNEKIVLENSSKGNNGQMITNISVTVGQAYQVNNNNGGTVETTFNISSDGSKWTEAPKKEADKEEAAQKTEEKSDGIRMSNMTYRQLLEEGLIDISKLQREIMKYVEAIRVYVRDDKDKLYLQLWARIMEHKAFAIDLYDRGKQDSKFNRNLVGNIVHYLDSKGFYKKPYNQSEMTRAFVEVITREDKNAEDKGALDPSRKGLREDPIQKHTQAIDEILAELQAK